MVSGQYVRTHGVWMNGVPLPEDAPSIAQHLKEQGGYETALLGTLVGNRGVILEQVLSTQPLKVMVDPGHNFALHTAAPAKAILAYMNPEDQGKIIDTISYTRFNENTIITKRQFVRNLKEAGRKVMQPIWRKKSSICTVWPARFLIISWNRLLRFGSPDPPTDCSPSVLMSSVILSGNSR